MRILPVPALRALRSMLAALVVAVVMCAATAAPSSAALDIGGAEISDIDYGFGSSRSARAPAMT